MRFFLDNDVPVSVGKMLRRHGHIWWTAAQAGLAHEGQDDNLTIYAAEHGAVLVTLDREFIRRRQANPIGQQLLPHLHREPRARLFPRTSPASPVR